jgi:hypothetical protein
LPESESTRNKILEREDTEITTPARLTTEAERKGGLMSLLNKKREEPKPEPEVTHKVKVEVKHTFTFKHESAPPPPPPPTRRETVDGGELTPERKTEPENRYDFSKLSLPPHALVAPAPQLPPPPVVVSQPWAAHYLVKLDEQIERAQRLLPRPSEIHVEIPTAPITTNPFAKKLGGHQSVKA